MAELSSGRREILDKLLAVREHQSPRLAARERAGSGEVSFAQERMWILDRLMPESRLYNETALLHFRRDVNPAVIERSLNEIIRRHEVLRTTFHWDRRPLNAGDCTGAHDCRAGRRSAPRACQTHCRRRWNASARVGRTVPVRSRARTPDPGRSVEGLRRSGRSSSRFITSSATDGRYAC